MEATETRSNPQWKPLGQLQFEETSCPVCKSRTGTLRNTKMIRGQRMQYFVCGECKALYANPRASVESLRDLYASADFFQGSEPGGDHVNYFDFIGGETYLRRTAKDRLSRLAKYQPSGRLLEVASAAGFFLIESRLAGYDVSGVEFSEPMARWSSEKWGVSVIPESVELVELAASTYDVIASWGVMTIIRDPVAFIRKVHQALKPGGVWAFNTYYYDGAWSKLVRNRWDILVLNFSQIYTRKLILDIVAREGFELLSRRREMPYTDLMKIGDKLVQNLSMTWLPKALEKASLDKAIIKIPLPDVMEYMWRKL